MSEIILAIIIGGTVGLFIVSMAKYLFFSKKNIYLITVSYTKFTPNTKIKSQRNKGIKINNQFVQFVLEINNHDSLIGDIGTYLKSEFPVCNNWKIEKIDKI